MLPTIGLLTVNDGRDLTAKRNRTGNGRYIKLRRMPGGDHRYASLRLSLRERSRLITQPLKCAFTWK